MDRSTRSSAVLITLLVCASATAAAAGAEGESSWTTPGWQRVTANTLPHLGEQFYILQGLGMTSAPPNTAARLEGALLLNAEPGSGTLVTLMSVRMAVDENRVAYGLRLPLILGPGMGEVLLASGDLRLERHSLTATPKRNTFTMRTWSLVLPAATSDLRLGVLGLDSIGGGLDWAQSSFLVSRQWVFHYEAVVGFRIDEEMPIRASASAAAALRIVDPFFLFAQMNTSLIATSLQNDPISFAMGARLVLGPLEAVVSLQRALEGQGDRAVVFAITLL